MTHFQHINKFWSSLCLVFALCVVVFLFGWNFILAQSTSTLHEQVYQESSSTEIDFIGDSIASVLSVQDRSARFGGELQDGAGYTILSIQNITMRLLSGPYKNSIISFENSVSSNPNNMVLRSGQIVSVRVMHYGDGSFEVQLLEVYRFFTLILILSIGFIILFFFLKFQILKLLFGLAFVLFGLLIFYSTPMVGICAGLLLALAVGIGKDWLNAFIAFVSGIFSAYSIQLFFINATVAHEITLRDKYASLFLSSDIRLLALIFLTLIFYILIVCDLLSVAKSVSLRYKSLSCWDKLKLSISMISDRLLLVCLGHFVLFVLFGLGSAYFIRGFDFSFMIFNEAIFIISMMYWLTTLISLLISIIILTFIQVIIQGFFYDANQKQQSLL